MLLYIIQANGNKTSGRSVIPPCVSQSFSSFVSSSSNNFTTLKKDQSLPSCVWQDRALAPVCCGVILVEVAMLLDARFNCRTWIRRGVEDDLRTVWISGRVWEHTILRPAWKSHTEVKCNVTDAWCYSSWSQVVFEWVEVYQAFKQYWLFLKSDLYGWYGTEAGTICSSLLQLYSRSTRGSTCIFSDGSRAEPERWPPFSDCCVEARLSSVCVNWEVESILCRPKREMQHLNLGSVATFSHCFGTTYITINYFLTFSFSIHLVKTWR